LGLLGVGLASGCMYAPVNGHTVPSRASAIPFEGYLFQPGERVSVNAKKPSDPSWFLIALDYAGTTSAGTYFGANLYPWNVTASISPWHWEPGAVGYRTQVRARQTTGQSSLLTTFDVTLNEVIACMSSATDWYDFQDKCGSDDSPVVTIETEDFVPDVTEGRTDCDYDDDAACSQCIDGVISQLTPPEIDIEHADAHLRLDHSIDLTGGHIQGLARLRDIVTPTERIGRWVQSDNATAAGYAYYEESVSNLAQDAIYQGQDASIVERYGARIDFDHPSGLAAHGDYVAMAIENRRSETIAPPAGVEPLDPEFELDDNTTAAVYFMRHPRYQGASAELVNVLELDGSIDAFGPGVVPGTSAVAFVQLADGHFLVAASANNHGRWGIWFYYSDRDELVPDTEWRLVDFWHPPCTTTQDGLGNCYAGSAGMALLTDCSGQIYLVNFNGTDTNWGAHQWWQTYRVSQTSTGEMDLGEPSWWRDYTGWAQYNNPAFRWAGGAYVSEDALPVLFNTERKDGVRDNDYIDGDLYYHH